MDKLHLCCISYLGSCKEIRLQLFAVSFSGVIDTSQTSELDTHWPYLPAKSAGHRKQGTALSLWVCLSMMKGLFGWGSFNEYSRPRAGRCLLYPKSHVSAFHSCVTFQSVNTKLAHRLKSAKYCYPQGTHNWNTHLGMIYGVTFPHWEFGSSCTEIELLPIGKLNIIMKDITHIFSSRTWGQKVILMWLIRQYSNSILVFSMYELTTYEETQSHQAERASGSHVASISKSKNEPNSFHLFIHTTEQRWMV